MKSPRDAEAEIASILDGLVAAAVECAEARAVGDGDDEAARLITKRNTIAARWAALVQERDALLVQRDRLRRYAEKIVAAQTRYDHAESGQSVEYAIDMMGGVLQQEFQDDN